MKKKSKSRIRTATLTLAAWGLFLPFLSFSDQTWEPIEEIFLEAQTNLNRDVYVKGQQAPASGIKCTPDTVFFSPTGPYNSGETSNTNLPGYALNQSKTWTGISSISNVGQQLVWPLLPLNTGLVNIEAYIEVSSSQAGAEVRVQLGDLDTVVTTVESDGTTPQPWGLTASVTNAGVAISAVQSFKLIFETPSPSSSSLGTVRSVSLTGAGMIDCYMLRARWRPAAAHCSFLAEGMPSGTYVTRWIMEERPDFLPSADVPDPASHYSPLTTPFGYFGSVFTPDPETPENDFTVSSPNFSMWHDRTDPVEELEHLIAIGTTVGEGIFGGFSHEGTGVKPRDMAPAFDGPQTSAVFSMGYTPPQAGSVYPYHAYVGHTYDAVSQQWKMYAAGRLYASSFNEIKADAPSSFVEVPGTGARQRTGQIKRTMDYRGWVLASNGQWYPLATISSNDPSTVDPLSKEFIASPDGWMRMTMGGMLHYLHYAESQATNVGTFPPQDFMEQDKLDDMTNNWGVVTLEDSVQYNAGQLTISFTLSHPGTVNLFYGSSEGSTLIFEDGNTNNYWDSKYELGYFEAGSYTNYTVAAPGVPLPGYCRLQVDSPTAAVGRFWSLEERRWSGGLVWTDAGQWHSSATLENWVETDTGLPPTVVDPMNYYEGGVSIATGVCNGDLHIGDNAVVIANMNGQMVSGDIEGNPGSTIRIIDCGTTVEKVYVGGGVAVTVDRNSTLRLTGEGNPIDGSTIDLNATTAVLQFKNETWADFEADHISKVTMFGAALEFGSDPYVNELGDNAVAADYNAPDGISISYTDGVFSLPVHEDFDGTLGESINGTGSGNGWSGNWVIYGGTADATTFKTSNGFSDGTASVATSGLSAGLSGGEDLQRSLSKEITVGTDADEYPEVWLSFLLDSTAGNAVGHEYRVVLSDEGADVVSFGKEVNAGWKLTTATTNVTFASSGASVGNYLGVVKLAFDGTDTVITGYLAKDSDAALDITDVSTFMLTHSVTNPGNMAFDTVRIRAHNTSTTTIDEIRLADNYLDSIGIEGSPQEPIGSIAFSGPLAGGLGLSWDSTLGQVYNVETNVDILLPIWGVYETVIGDGGGIVVTATVDQATLFYKVTTP